MTPTITDSPAITSSSAKPTPAVHENGARSLDELHWRELRTVQDFRAAKAAPDRIVITDSAKPHPTVHDSRCHTLLGDRFVTKVITNANRNGRYYAVANTRLAEAGGAVKCGACYR